MGEVDDRGPKASGIAWLEEDFKNAVAQNRIRPGTGRIVQDDVESQ